MAECYFEISNLSAAVQSKAILHHLDLKIQSGETHILMGPNGAGKSTLGNVIMGSPNYEVTEGKMILEGEDITALNATKRAQKGLFLSFQSPIEVPGVSLFNFIRAAQNARPDQRKTTPMYKKQLADTLDLLNMDEKYVFRDLNVGFSGGEKKKAEILQLLMLAPKLAILDETDSGLDVDAMKTVAKGIEEFQRRKQGSLLIITHNTKFLENLHVDYVHILVGGKLVKTGDQSLLKQVDEQGFEAFL